MAKAKEQRWFHLVGMSNRTGNAVDALLTANGRNHDLWELTRFTALDLIKVPGIGREMIREIITLLAENGYALATPADARGVEVEWGELRIVVRRLGDQVRRLKARLSSGRYEDQD